MRQAALALLAVATPAAARFAPVPDTTYRLTIAATRDDGRAVRRTEATYDVRFSRSDDDGWGATLVQRSGGDAVSANFVDLPVEVRLDRRGRAIGVTDAEAWWARLRTGIVAHAPATARDAMLAAHDATPETARLRILAGDLLDLIADADTDRRPGSHATSLPASDGTHLLARETVTRDRGAVTVTTHAAGPLAGDAQATIARTRVIDRATGLVRDLAETRRVEAGDRRLVVVKTARLASPVSQYPSRNPRDP